MLCQRFGFFVGINRFYAQIKCIKLNTELNSIFISKYIFLLKTNRFGKYIEIVKQALLKLNFVGFVLKY